MGSRDESLPLREQIRTEPIKLGVAIASASPAAVEMAGLAGCDFVWIEVEHAGTGLDQVEALCRAAEVHNMWPLVRVADGTRTSILRHLEVGARIIVVPQVHTAVDARQVALHGKFAPVGQRGWNLGSRGMGYGTKGTPLEAMRWANDATVLLVQIESVEGVRNAEAILATQGVDGVLVGPGDLSNSMGIPAQWDNEELIQTVEGVFATAHRHEKVVATVCPTPALTRRWKAAGAHMLCVASDLPLLRTSIATALSEVRAI